MVTGANPTPTVPQLLTGRPMQSRERLLSPGFPNSHFLHETSPPDQETANNSTPSDPITRTAEVIVGMNNRPGTQTFLVLPVSTNTLTFDGKSEKFELFEDLFHKMNKMQQ